MSQNKSTASVSNGSGSKDLSCLRCRKKKAKCSKTRPACTRCARSNQPCEYPDAPPNLTDLSQKVLSLYDTLRELEDKFMLQYAVQEQEQTEQLARAGEKRRRRSSSGYSNPKSPPDDLPSIETLTLLNPAKRSRQHSLQRSLKEEHMQPPEYEEQEQEDDPSFIAQKSLPGNWSMSLTSDGLSLHAVARNMIEFSTFAKDFSHQLRNNDPENKLTKSWEWYEEETIAEDEDDPLDEDEYLVTVPVYSLSSLLANNSRHQNNDNDTSVYNNHNNTATTTATLSPMIPDDGDDTLYNNRIQPALDDIITHLRKTYDLLAMDEYPIHLFHICTLIQQLQPFVLQSGQQQQIQPIQLVPTITAYAASVQLLFQQQQPSSSTQLYEDCISYATSALIELVFQRQSMDPLPIVASAALLAWMGKSDMAHLATRVLCGCDAWDENSSKWQHLAASLLYFEVYSTTFSTPFIQRQQQRRRHYEIGEAETWLLQSAKRLINRSSSDSVTYHASGLGLETELVCLLKQVFALFYNKNECSDNPGTGVGEDSKNESTGNDNIRKVDVDDVLKLVRNIEEWEHQLPKWAQWTATATATTPDNDDEHSCSRWPQLRTHIHLIHNIVKILLFRPFSIEPSGSHQHHAGREQQEGEDGSENMQTHTRTTFLDLSMAAADRAVTCITRLHDSIATKRDVDDDEWVQAGYHLAQDVIQRVKEAFPCDDELLVSVCEIEGRLGTLESLPVSSSSS